MFNFPFEDIFESNIEINHSYENNQIEKKPNIKLLKIKIITILENLKKAKTLNSQLQLQYLDEYNKAEAKLKHIENLLEKVKRVSKSKPKKHIKYSSYIPLEHIYFYTTKKIHIYYNLLEKVFSSCKKGKNEENILPKKNINRFNFTKQEDKTLINLCLLSDDKNPINWFIISEEMNKFIKREKTKKSKLLSNNENSERIFTPLICYVRYLETSSFYKYKKWTKNEDTILRKAILYYGPKNWQQISYCLDGRNNSQCFHRWMKGINPKIKRDKWTFIEDLTLGVALSKIYLKKNWSKIANHLPGRTDIQCRERWCNILDPALEEVEWSKEEDIKLLELNAKYGNKWSKIAKEFGNRTDNTCWRRWKFLRGNPDLYQQNKNSKDKSFKGVQFKVIKSE